MTEWPNVYFNCLVLSRKKMWFYLRCKLPPRSARWWNRIIAIFHREDWKRRCLRWHFLYCRKLVTLLSIPYRQQSHLGRSQRMTMRISVLMWSLQTSLKVIFFPYELCFSLKAKLTISSLQSKTLLRIMKIFCTLHRIPEIPASHWRCIQICWSWTHFCWTILKCRPILWNVFLWRQCGFLIRTQLPILSFPSAAFWMKNHAKDEQRTSRQDRSRKIPSCFPMPILASLLRHVNSRCPTANSINSSLMFRLRFLIPHRYAILIVVAMIYRHGILFPPFFFLLTANRRKRGGNDAWLRISNIRSAVAEHRVQRLCYDIAKLYWQRWLRFCQLSRQSWVGIQLADAD